MTLTGLAKHVSVVEDAGLIVTEKVGRDRQCFVEHSPDGTHGFEGRFREVTPIERIVQASSGMVCPHTSASRL